MGKLSLQEIPLRVQKPSLNKELEQIKKHDQQACFHTEPTKDVNYIPYLENYFQWVSTIIASEKFAVFKHLMKMPIETVDFTEGTLNELRKALEGQDRHVAVQMTSPELVNDYISYLKLIHDEDFWQTEAFNAIKSNINAIIVCDLPAIPFNKETGEFKQSTKYATPYYYLLDPDRLVDADVHRSGKMEWIIFKDADVPHKYFAFDEDYFRSFVLKDGKILQETLVEVPHFLGFCPTHTFWSTPFNKDSKLQRRGPISNSLGKLDWLLFCYTSTKHASLYSGFPIYVMYERRCQYQDAGGNACQSGKISRMVPGGIDGSEMIESVVDCPACKDKAILGAGTVLTAPAMAEKDEPDLLKGVNVIPAEVESLAWLEKYIDKQEQKLNGNMVGFAKEVNEAAKNEDQVQSGFESRLNVIMWVKRNLEIAHKFVLDTCGKLRYGSTYMGSTVNYGTKFYLYDFEDLLVGYESSRKNGLPNFELTSQFDQMLATKYRTNPEMLQRAMILKQVEPFINYSLGELKSLPGQLDERLVTLKKNFDSYVSRFEREFTNIASFLPYGDVSEKVDFIKAQLMKYVEQDMAAMPKPEPVVDPAAQGGGRFGQ